MTVTMPSTLDTTRAFVEPALRAAIARLDPWSRQVASYHLGFASGPIVCVDETPRSASARHELRPNATTGCLLLVLEWLRGRS